jgi:TonB family protein
MKKINTKSVTLIMGVMAITLGIVSCKSGADSNQAIADSLQAKITADSIAKVNQEQSMQQTTVAGVAQPNPEKKHGKGKVVFQTEQEARYDKEYAAMVIEMDKEGIYSRAEIKPTFPGGQDALAKFIQENIVYPDAAIDNGVEATVDVIFAVDENGKVYTPRLKSQTQGYGLDEASLNVVSKMPRWNPGQIKGKNVKSYYTLPISFVIN